MRRAPGSETQVAMDTILMFTAQDVLQNNSNLNKETMLLYNNASHIGNML